MGEEYAALFVKALGTITTVETVQYLLTLVHQLLQGEHFGDTSVLLHTVYLCFDS
jgi:hypothetical protein